MISVRSSLMKAIKAVGEALFWAFVALSVFNLSRIYGKASSIRDALGNGDWGYAGGVLAAILLELGAIVAATIVIGSRMRKRPFQPVAQIRSYRWGKVHGWLMIVGGVLWLIICGRLWSLSTLPDLGGKGFLVGFLASHWTGAELRQFGVVGVSAEYVITGVRGIILGIAILRRSVYLFPLLGWTILASLLGGNVLAGVLNALTCYYYIKRRQEFGMPGIKSHFAQAGSHQ